MFISQRRHKTIATKINLFQGWYVYNIVFSTFQFAKNQKGFYSKGILLTWNLMYLTDTKLANLQKLPPDAYEKRCSFYRAPLDDFFWI